MPPKLLTSDQTTDSAASHNQERLQSSIAKVGMTTSLHSSDTALPSTFPNPIPQKMDSKKAISKAGSDGSTTKAPQKNDSEINYGEHREIKERELSRIHYDNLVAHGIMTETEAAKHKVGPDRKGNLEVKWEARHLDPNLESGLEMPGPGWEKRIKEKSDREEAQIRRMETADVSGHKGMDIERHSQHAFKKVVKTITEGSDEEDTEDDKSEESDDDSDSDSSDHSDNDDPPPGPGGNSSKSQGSDGTDDDMNDVETPQNSSTEPATNTTDLGANRERVASDSAAKPTCSPALGDDFADQGFDEELYDLATDNPRSPGWSDPSSTMCSNASISPQAQKAKLDRSQPTKVQEIPSVVSVYESTASGSANSGNTVAKPTPTKRTASNPTSKPKRKTTTAQMMDVEDFMKPTRGGYHAMGVFDLRDELGKRGLDGRGKVPILQKRLRDDDADALSAEDIAFRDTQGVHKREKFRRRILRKMEEEQAAAKNGGKDSTNGHQDDDGSKTADGIPKGPSFKDKVAQNAREKAKRIDEMRKAKAAAAMRHSEMDLGGDTDDDSQMEDASDLPPIAQYLKLSTGKGKAKEDSDAVHNTSTNRFGERTDWSYQPVCQPGWDWRRLPIPRTRSFAQGSRFRTGYHAPARTLAADEARWALKPVKPIVDDSTFVDDSAFIDLTGDEDDSVLPVGNGDENAVGKDEEMLDEPMGVVDTTGVTASFADEAQLHISQPTSMKKRKFDDDVNGYEDDVDGAKVEQRPLKKMKGT